MFQLSSIVDTDCECTGRAAHECMSSMLGSPPLHIIQSTQAVPKPHGGSCTTWQPHCCVHNMQHVPLIHLTKLVLKRAYPGQWSVMHG